MLSFPFSITLERTFDYTMSTVTNLINRLEKGEILLMDGGIGTELERLGAPMDHTAWCAVALQTHPQLVKEVHRSYIEAGADIITVNSFASTRKALENAKMEEKFCEWNRLAVQLTKEALADCEPDRRVYIAGSVSTYGYDPEITNNDGELESYLKSHAEVLVESGVDLLLIETLASDLSTIFTAIAALSNYDLPIFVAVSCSQIDKTEKLYLGALESRNYSDKEDIFFHEPFDSVLDKLTTRGGYSALLVMHSEIDITQSAITRISEKYKGPIGAYPNAGYWERPQWVFVDQISPDDYVQKARSWVEEGVQIVGGCCGIGPEHIRALTQQYHVV